VVVVQVAQGEASSTLERARVFRARAIRLFLGLAPTERSRLFILTLVIGGVCGLAAVAFHASIRAASAALIERSLRAPGNAWIVWALLTPTLGAGVAGLLLQYVAPNARGSGIPQVKYVYAVKSGRLRLRDALAKFLVASIQLGTGSSLGREGPTVQICASIASSLGRIFAISPNSLRRLIPVGAAAGIAAAFNAPIAAVTFTIEEIVGDLDQTVLSGVVVAAALAAAVEHSVLGGHPVFSVPGSYALEHASSLLVYALLGAAAAIASHLFYVALLKLRGRCRAASGLHSALLPTLGGFVTGGLAVGVGLSLGTQGILGDGYATLSAALIGHVPLQVMLVLVVGKLVATVLCYATGGAGGIFAPVLFIGGMLGGVFGHLDQLLLAHPSSELGAFALVGMGAFFAAVIRAPITSVLIIFEMTRGYGLILPLMIANTAAYMLARTWHPVPIYEALLDQDGLHLPHTQRAAAALSAFRVSEAMTTELITLAGSDKIEDALAQIKTSGFSIYPVLDAHGGFLGLISEARLRRCVAEGRGDQSVASEARAEKYLESDMPLVDAVAAMSAFGARQMAVVERSIGQARLRGILAMSDVMRAHSKAAEGLAAPEAAEGTSVRGAVKWKHRDVSGRFSQVSADQLKASVPPGPLTPSDPKVR
jgi:chloride channel protein, CIC family